MAINHLLTIKVSLEKCPVGLDQNKRFNSAQEIQIMLDCPPVTELNGQKNWVHWRWHCSKLVRQSFIEWSEKSVSEQAWKEYYLPLEKRIDELSTKMSSSQALEDTRHEVALYKKYLGQVGYQFFIAEKQ
jgi:hypothetical protein